MSRGLLPGVLKDFLSSRIRNPVCMHTPVVSDLAVFDRLSLDRGVAEHRRICRFVGSTRHSMRDSKRPWSQPPLLKGLSSKDWCNSDSQRSSAGEATCILLPGRIVLA